ncbi:MAG: hypothetical protein LBG72_03045 [Spirochaetaceae bacterium]|jgi:hypothetical protein|nr:hypothetical protein [Spirochaetaceae bacterium]
MNLKFIYRTIFIFIAGTVFLSCFNTVFYMVQSEVQPKAPIINGSPSKIVSDETNLYTANGSIWKWTNDKWSEISAPAAGIHDVAYVKSGGAAGLYALSVDNANTTLYRQDADIWTKIPFTGNGNIQSIYGAEDTLFAAAAVFSSSGTVFTAWKYDGGFTQIKKDADNFSACIYGAVKFNSNYYIAAADGVYIGTGDTFTLVKEQVENRWTTASRGEWMGIAVDGVKYVIAVSRSGYVYFNNAGAESVTQPETTYRFTGAVCFWHDLSDETRIYALIGIRSTSYTNGYRELQISPTPLGSYTTPETISVQDGNKYASTIGTQAVKSIIQAPRNEPIDDGRPLLFAATQQYGIRAYRGVWNAEE